MVRFAAVVFALTVTSLGLSARGADILLLDFWSPQCGPCMQMKPTMRAFEQANYPIREIDTTRDFEMSRRFGVSQIPCFVMLVDDQEVDRHVGPISSEELQKMFQKAKEVYAQRHAKSRQEPPGTVRLQDSPLDASRSAPPSTVGPAPRLEGNTASQSAPWPQPSANSNPQHGTAVAAGTGGDFPSSLMAATVRIRVEDSQGRAFGTGTIIDSRSGEALIVTCGHLFRESKGKGPMTVELFESDANGLRVTGSVPGHLISYDLERDVAFVSIRPNRQVSVAPVAPARTRIERGDRVATIGCSNGSDPTLLPQKINMLDRYQGPPNIEVSGAPEEGRSGGGLFNLQGQLIGVCYAADYEGKEGLYAALESIHEELNRLQLADVYTKAAEPRVASQQPTVIRGQVLENQPPITPITGPEPSPAGDALASGPQKLSDAEQAAFGEIMQRASTSEVVVIVRPKTPGGQSEVITLDSVSPEFVQALAERQRNPQTPAAK